MKMRDKKVFYFLSPKYGYENKVFSCLSLKRVVKIKDFSYSLSRGRKKDEVFSIFSPQRVVVKIQKSFVCSNTFSPLYKCDRQGGGGGGGGK